MPHGTSLYAKMKASKYTVKVPKLELPTGYRFSKTDGRPSLWEDSRCLFRVNGGWFLRFSGYQLSNDACEIPCCHCRMRKLSARSELRVNSADFEVGENDQTIREK